MSPPAASRTFNAPGTFDAPGSVDAPGRFNAPGTFDAPGGFSGPRKFNAPLKFWALHREISLNWIALGLLLAAWNTSDNDAGLATARRPEALRNHGHVSVRAVARTGAIPR